MNGWAGEIDEEQPPAISGRTGNENAHVPRDARAILNVQIAFAISALPGYRNC